MTKEEFIKRCKETRDAFVSDREIEQSVETLFCAHVVTEEALGEDNLKVYSMMALMFQKAADYCLNGSYNEATVREQRRKAKNYSRFIGGRVASSK